MNALRAIALALWVLLLALPAAAVIETYEFSEPELEKRYRELSQELRCPKCQNQNIADSNAPISQDLRRLLHQQLEAGASDGEILEYMVARYGEFVRYRPAFNAATAILWLAPRVYCCCCAAASSPRPRSTVTTRPGSRPSCKRRRKTLDHIPACLRRPGAAQWPVLPVSRLGHAPAPGRWRPGQC